MIAILALILGACNMGADPYYSAQMRNDSSTTYLVDFTSVSVARVFWVPGHSTMQLYSLVGVGPSYDYSSKAVIYLTDCSKVATVQLNQDLDTIYADSAGAVSVRAHRDVPYENTTELGYLQSPEPGCPAGR
ncbi:MAG TPA: hypothetical protein VF337_05640 [Candidatus Limnocylindrales bacterium]